MTLVVYPNQITAGTQILEFFYAGIDHVILIAQMQSGKTGTAKYVVSQLISLHNYDPKDIFFICGMNDNDLLSQAQREFAHLLPVDNILFSKQLQKINGNSSAGLNVRCVIIDESHYASNNGSQVDLFLQNRSAERCFTLSVSATPMAEMAASRDSSVGIVRLLPGPNYYSLTDIFANGLINESVSITHHQDKFIDLVTDQIQQQKENGEKKYNIVRLPNQYYYKDLEEELNELALDIAFINHHTSEKNAASDFNDYIREAPAKSTIIWIYGGLRAGKQLNTQHIGFVHDTACSGPDTIAQSLLGRIMGYNKERNGVVCFTDMNAATLMLEWIKKGFDTTLIPSHSRSILNGYANKSYTWHHHPPLMVTLDRTNADYYRDLKLKWSNRYPYRDNLLFDIQQSATVNRGDIDAIFQHYVPGLCGGLMVLTEFNVKRSFAENWTLNYEKYIKGLPTGNFLTVVTDAPGHYYIYVNLHRGSAEYGKAVIVYKEWNKNEEIIPSEYIGVNRKSRFHQLKSPIV